MRAGFDGPNVVHQGHGSLTLGAVTRYRSMLWIALGLLCGIAGCRGGDEKADADREMTAPAPASQPAAVQDAPSRVSAEAVAALLSGQPEEQWYGVYMLGRKVGHARMWTRPGSAQDGGGFATGTDIEMTVKGAGADMSMSVSEARHYAGTPPYGLQWTTFSQRTPLATDRREARVRAEDGKFVVRRLDDPSAPPRTLGATRDSLAAALASTPARVDDLTAGDRTSVVMFDWQTEKDQPLTVEVQDVVTLQRAGVSVRVAVIGFHYEAMGLEGTSRVADGGVMLETTVGPGLMLKLEEREVARGGVQGLDVMGANVQVEGNLPNPRSIDALSLRVTMPEGQALPAGPRQVVSRPADGAVDVTLRRIPGAAVTDAERAASLSPEGAIDSDSKAVRAAATEASGGVSERRALVERLNRWVFEAIEKRLATHVPSASAVLDRRIGDCTEHTWLFVAMARALGVPARPVYGLMYLDSEPPSFGYHAWAEVEVDGRWLAVDPTWDQVPADATHLRLGGAAYEVAAVIGGLSIEIVEAPGGAPTPRPPSP